MLPQIASTAGLRRGLHTWNRRIRWKVFCGTASGGLHTDPKGARGLPRISDRSAFGGLYASVAGEWTMPNKKTPVRRTASAEEYAQKVRMEPPKASRQEGPLVAKGKVTARQHNMKKSRISRRSPS